MNVCRKINDIWVRLPCQEVGRNMGFEFYKVVHELTQTPFNPMEWEKMDYQKDSYGISRFYEQCICTHHMINRTILKHIPSNTKVMVGCVCSTKFYADNTPLVKQIKNDKYIQEKARKKFQSGQYKGLSMWEVLKRFNSPKYDEEDRNRILENPPTNDWENFVRWYYRLIN